jgi:uncharacterized membrane protein (DUF373 family)
MKQTISLLTHRQSYAELWRPIVTIVGSFLLAIIQIELFLLFIVVAKAFTLRKPTRQNSQPE